MSTEIHIDVNSAAQDSMKHMQRVLVNAYDINNLNVSAFVTATGKQVQLKSEKVSDRPEGISFSGFLITWIRVQLTQELCRNLHSFHSVFAYHSTGTFQKKVVLKECIHRCQSSRVQKKIKD